jgi:hypothetical protein
LKAEEGVAPLPPAPEPEKSKYTREDAEELASQLMVLRQFVVTIDEDKLKRSIKFFRDHGGMDDALGCLLKPDGYHERADVNRAQVDFLDGILKIVQAHKELEKALAKQRENKGQLSEILKRMGLE